MGSEVDGPAAGGRQRKLLATSQLTTHKTDCIRRVECVGHHAFYLYLRAGNNRKVKVELLNKYAKED